MEFEKIRRDIGTDIEKRNASATNASEKGIVWLEDAAGTATIKVGDYYYGK